MKRRKWGRWLLLASIAACMAMLVRHYVPLLFAPEIHARAAILIDAQTGAVYYESNADEALPPASMSKMMTELLILEDVCSGKRRWNETVRISSYAANVPGSKIGVKPKDTYTVRELFEAMVVHSANDAAVALAEQASGTESKFVTRMNQTAKKLGLSSGTVFANATGLPSADIRGFQSAAAAGDTEMTARDIAKLAARLVTDYPEVLDITRKPQVTLARTNLTLQATNLMLPGEAYAYSGNDGLKTGFTDEAGYCFTGTAMRGGRRLITVVMGTAAPEARFVETGKLLTYGFARP
ncbi:D-alanyl-D-alanine carboxypeptidase DacA [Paenibacillus solanacearum]|uniref:D-alanyl-D-alanine carboxypeptidase DacA n=1 Tax=Paenibacillus solanacearum TaxID=2048548 RepID=A0A916K0J0_9BACL|nr:D-alanyl-D-alanine carboxypeptidase family protein [Paenibacillus solanacearum]CAG7619095.1 D-alanyl-D-alanine carboxypeptidase DacA [Paenibacillus solanacearum]